MRSHTVESATQCLVMSPYVFKAVLRPQLSPSNLAIIGFPFMLELARLKLAWLGDELLQA